MAAPQYIEFECPSCKTYWEVYCKGVVYGDDDYGLIPVSDDLTGFTSSFKCEECGAEGERT